MHTLKRKLKSAEDVINDFNIRRSSDAIIVEREKLFSSESRKVKMSELLRKIPSKVKVKSNGHSFVEYSLTRPSGNKFTTVRLKQIDYQKLFSIENFVANLNHVFNCVIGEENFKIKLFSKLNFKIELDTPCLALGINVRNQDKSEFMFLACMFFGMLFNITIDVCACHPCSFQDFVLLDAGITKNCISNDCSTRILADPLLFDPLIHYDCSQKANSNILFVGLNLHSPKEISVNLQLNQQIEENKKNNL